MHRQYLHVDAVPLKGSPAKTIAYLDSAPAHRTARVILLIHGFPLSASMWEPQFKAIPAGWRMIAPDLRGFGGSTLPDAAESPSMDDYASDLIDLLRELGIQTAVVGGLSMGGYVTFALLRRSPRIANALVLADTRANADSLQGRGNRRSMLALLDREGPSGVAVDMMGRLVGQTTRELRPEIESTVRMMIKQQSAGAIRGAIFRMMERPDSIAVLSTVTVPTVVIVGEEDVLTPVEESRKIAAAVPKAELVVLPGAGHLANLEQPEVFNATLARFLSQL